MRQEYAWRSIALFSFMAAAAFVVLAQMIRIQYSPQADWLRSRAEANAGAWRTFFPERGEIYDRNGHLLAGNETVYTVGVNMPDLKDAHTVALNLSMYLGMDYDETMQKLANPDGLVYLTLRNYVSGEEAAPLMALQAEMAAEALENNQPSMLAGLEFQPHLQRSYPELTLAANVLGFVSRDGHGYFGVEEKYNDLLAGNPVQVWVPEDPNRANEIPRVPNGTALILTIHRDLQAAAETSLDQALIDYGAQNGAIVIMDPRTGEILAMATHPRMNLNQFWNYDSYFTDGSQFNPAISVQYEPGSVFKILTMAAGLDTGAITPDTLFNDTGAIEVGGVVIQNWDRRPWGAQNMIGCLQHSLNVCHAWISTTLGSDVFYGYMERFGIGHPTGIDLAGEAPGRLKIPGDLDWYPVDLGTNAFGQGVAVTPIQMLMAASALANEGRMVVPHVLYAMVREGRQVNIDPQFGGNPVSAQTARTISDMLAISLENEASMALVPGYRVAGKTGTAQIPVEGYYDSEYTNASF
ncbi:MAG: penicillin-binding protein 2, partial [Chloroflexota bacterium]